MQPYYKYKPNTILNNDTVKLYWDRDIITDKTTPNNRPDITLTLKNQRITHLIDTSIPNTDNIGRNIQKKYKSTYRSQMKSDRCGNNIQLKS